MNILLVNPSAVPGLAYPDRDSMRPVSLLFLSSYLLRKGYRSKILDLSTAPNPQGALCSLLGAEDPSPLGEHCSLFGAEKPDIVGFTSTTENRFAVWEMITATRLLLPDCLIIAGGHHFTHTAHEALKAITGLDIVVRGEGEVILLNLVRAIENNSGLEKVKGITFRSANGEIIENEDGPYEMNLDELLISDDVFEDVILPYGNYSDFMLLRNYEEDQLKALPIHVGRGCPHKCVYCLYGKVKYRTRRAASVAKEIEEKHIAYNCDVFHLQDPNISKNKKFLKELCDELDSRRLNIKWYAEARADLNLEMLEVMAKSGCISLDIALESGSNTVLQSIRKNTNVEQTSRVIDACHELGIRTYIFLMISLPDETRDDVYSTVEFVKSKLSKLSKIEGFSVTHIYPGTEIEQMAFERGILSKDFSWYDKVYTSAMPELHPTTPLWMEHLDATFIRKIMDELQELIKAKERLWELRLELFCRAAMNRLHEDGEKRLSLLVSAFDEFLGEYIPLRLMGDIKAGKIHEAAQSLQSFEHIVLAQSVRISLIIFFLLALSFGRDDDRENKARSLTFVSHLWDHPFPGLIHNLSGKLREHYLFSALSQTLSQLDESDPMFATLLYHQSWWADKNNERDKAYRIREVLEKRPITSNTKDFVFSALYHNAIHDYSNGDLATALRRLDATLQLNPKHFKARELYSLIIKSKSVDKKQ